MIKQGDCLELMKEIPAGSVDAIICDPPYGITNCAFDVRIPFEPMWEQFKRVTKKKRRDMFVQSNAVRCRIDYEQPQDVSL